jgi:hypothetical protein
MRRFLVAAAVVAGVCLVGAGPAWAVTSGRIIYNSVKKDDFGVRTVLPDGSGEQSLPNGGSDYAWSPGGQRIAFTDNRGNIFTMRSDGSGVEQLTFGGTSSPVYAPGGRRIAFGSFSGVWTVRTDGSHRRKLGPDDYAAPVAWTRDGQIMFGKGAGIWTMRPNGRHKRRLVRGNPPFVVNPNGEEFIFKYQGEFHLADIDGSHIRQAPCGLRAPLITYSPSGRWLLIAGYDTIDPATKEPTSWFLFTLSLRTCDSYRIVGQTTGDAAWQPLRNG